jgi:hypothetical protein
MRVGATQKIFIGVLMKTHYLWLALLAAFPLFAHADDGFYIDGSLGRDSAVSYMPSSNIVNVDIGHRWSWFGVDVGYVSMSKERRTAYGVMTLPETTEYPIHFGLSEHGTVLDASGRWNIGKWYYGVKAGLYSWHATYTADAKESPVFIKSSTSGQSWNAAVGLGYDFTKNFGLGVSADWYHTDFKTVHPISLDVEYRF